MSNLKWRPSPALVISLVALFVALAGGAYAATKIDTSDIKKAAVTGKKLAKDAVNSNKVKDASLTGGDLADGAISGSKLAGITEVEETTTATVSPSITATAECPSGSTVISGGFRGQPTGNVFAERDQRDGNGWRADGFASAPGDTITAYAYCLEG